MRRNVVILTLSALLLALSLSVQAQEPTKIPWWSRGRVTLLGDAALPMYPRGSNGAGQAILDARALTGCLRRIPDVEAALGEYERLRHKATADLVLTNRSNPPDAILREVWRRSGDKPFARIEDVISPAEMAEMSPDRRSPTRTGAWARRSPSIPRP